MAALVAPTCFRNYNNHRVSFDPDKRVRTLKDRGLDFEDASRVFSGVTLEIEDTRRNYDERRIIC